MLAYIVVLILITISVMLTPVLCQDAEEDWNTITVCRTSCMEQLLPESAATEDCEHDSDCHMVSHTTFLQQNKLQCILK